MTTLVSIRDLMHAVNRAYGDARTRLLEIVGDASLPDVECLATVVEALGDGIFDSGALVSWFRKVASLPGGAAATLAVRNDLRIALASEPASWDQGGFWLDAYQLADLDAVEMQGCELTHTIVVPFEPTSDLPVGSQDPIIKTGTSGNRSMEAVFADADVAALLREFFTDRWEPAEDPEIGPSGERSYTAALKKWVKDRGRAKDFDHCFWKNCRKFEKAASADLITALKDQLLDTDVEWSALTFVHSPAREPNTWTAEVHEASKQVRYSAHPRDLCGR